MVSPLNRKPAKTLALRNCIAPGGCGRPQGLGDIRDQRPPGSNCSQIAEKRPPHGGFATVSVGRVPKQQEHIGR